MCHEQMALHVVIKRNVFLHLYFLNDDVVELVVVVDDDDVFGLFKHDSRRVY